MLIQSWAHAGRLALIYGLAVLGVGGGALLAQPFIDAGDLENTLWLVPAIAIMALAPVPVIAATALLKRDFGLTAVLFALPAMLGTLFCTGIAQLLVIAVAANMSL